MNIIGLKVYEDYEQYQLEIIEYKRCGTSSSIFLKCQLSRNRLCNFGLLERVRYFLFVNQLKKKSVAFVH